MSTISMRLVTDQFKRPESGGRLSGWIPEAITIAVSLAAVGLVVVFCVKTSGIAALLTATSIMTGLTFTMALRFWERSLDARFDQKLRFDFERTEVLDGLRSLLIWTVLAGVISTLWLGALALVVGGEQAPVWATAVAAALTTYQLGHVVIALLRLYDASFLLRY